MKRKKDRSNGITALYERLSRDDNAGESNSITHQKQMLEDYAIKNGFTKTKKESSNITQSAIDTAPRLIGEIIHDSNKAIADMRKEENKQEIRLSIYRQKSPKELLGIIPENNWMLSLPEYYTRYPFFYTSLCFLNADGVIPYVLLNVR